MDREERKGESQNIMEEWWQKGGTEISERHKSCWIKVMNGKKKKEILCKEEEN